MSDVYRWADPWAEIERLRERVAWEKERRRIDRRETAERHAAEIRALQQHVDSVIQSAVTIAGQSPLPITSGKR